MGSSVYNRERLEGAAKGARTLTEACERLGVEKARRRYIHDRMRKLGVDVSHFQRGGVKWTREILERAVASSRSVNEVLQHLGLNVVGGHHTHISRRIKAYGIDTSHFRAPTRRGEQRRPQNPESLLVEQPSAGARRIHSDRLRAALAASGVPKRCAGCGNEGVWLGEPLPLEVDHIDGNWRDNRIGNLRLLCPNCHSTTDTYRGRGKRRLS